VKRTMSLVDYGADALRKHEQGHRVLNDWTIISAAQRQKWREKAAVVIDAYNAAIYRNLIEMEKAQ